MGEGQKTVDDTFASAEREESMKAGLRVVVSIWKILTFAPSGTRLQALQLASVTAHWHALGLCSIGNVSGELPPSRLVMNL